MLWYLYVSSRGYCLLCQFVLYELCGITPPYDEIQIKYNFQVLVAYVGVCFSRVSRTTNSQYYGTDVLFFFYFSSTSNRLKVTVLLSMVTVYACYVVS